MKYDDNETETFGVIVTVTSKIGATCVYGQYDFRKIVEAGCRELGYTCLLSNVETVIKVHEGDEGKVLGKDTTYLLGIVIQPKD